MITNLLRLAAASLLAAAAVVLVPSTAFACSCVTASEAWFAEHADVVLVGTVVDSEGPPWWRLTRSSGDPVTYRVAVDRVLKGASGPATVVRSASSEATCGVDLDVGETYLVFAQRDREGALGVGLCDGTRRATPAAVLGVEDLLGPAYAPDPSIPPAGDEAAVWPLGSGGLLAAGGAALAAVGLVVWRRRNGRA